MAKRYGKQVGEQHLPNRHALNTLTKGDPSQRTINNYSKATPSIVDDSMAGNMLQPPSKRPYPYG